jgi:hypothetical protein
MVNGKTLLSILTKFVKGSEVGGNARIQIQMPNSKDSLSVFRNTLSKLRDPRTPIQYPRCEDRGPG